MFDQCLYFNTTSLARLLEREWTAAFKPFELTPPQAFLLRTVLNQPGLLQRELADMMTIARPTATRLLDGLQEKALIERRSSANDGREWEIHPTRAARAIETGLNEASGAVTKRLKKQLGTDVFAGVVGQLKEIRSSLG
ncbi:MarR family transcriptional regulator [Uliginosibacterium sp. H3]|uniref:MarR family transcriptional regulator n=1 Tax=Uliginosibacterium silvisoli TaxID=3114758 RepID=A0ABU6JZJ0_9RHOO|nr:MarR family transcriptional regulator [Uliginosibacterium sp. H3]